MRFSALESMRSQLKPSPPSTSEQAAWDFCLIAPTKRFYSVRDWFRCPRSPLFIIPLVQRDGAPFGSE